MATRSRAYFVLLLAVVMIQWDAVNSLPTGAPTSACASLTPSHVLSPQSSPSPYTISVRSSSYRANDQITVDISSSSTDFKGILLQMRRSDNDAVIGSWTVSDTNNYQTIACTNPNGAVTHKNRDTKASPVSFVWHAPATAEVSVYVTATFVQSFVVYWVAVRSPEVTADASPPDPCQSNPCLSGGTCTTMTTVGSSYTCECPPFRMGDTCHLVTPPCSTHPCQNGGTCTNNNQFTNFMCSCAAGFTGVMCDQIVPPCDSNPCQNGGTCTNINQNTDFMCSCASGFTGTTCEEIATDRPSTSSNGLQATRNATAAMPTVTRGGGVVPTPNALQTSVMMLIALIAAAKITFLST